MSRLSRWHFLGLLALVLAVSFAAWFFYPRAAPVDMSAVFKSNLQGVGLMERFEYARAVKAFERVVELAPDWEQGRINLGIALLNTDQPDNLKRAGKIFEGVLKNDAGNPYAHFCLGILSYYENKPEQARSHFEKVTKIDAGDANAWYWLGRTYPPGSAEARQAFARAIECDPYHGGALYGLAMENRLVDPNKAKALLSEHGELEKSRWTTLSKLAYSGMGKYAEVIGRPETTTAPTSSSAPLPRFEHMQPHVKLEAGTRWASDDDLGAGATGQLCGFVRERFGIPLVLLDYDNDGRLDLYLASAVLRKGKLGDVLLQNQPDGNWLDVSRAQGLDKVDNSFAVAVADYDNDRRADLCLTGANGLRVLRNDASLGFVDVTVEAGLTFQGVALGSAFVDLDQDGDLDLLVSQYAATTAEALSKLAPKDTNPEDKQGNTGGARVFLNVGEALPGVVSKEAKLATRFRRADKKLEDSMGAMAANVNCAVGDFDLDRDVDVLFLGDHRPVTVAINDRLLKFHTQTVDTGSPSKDGVGANETGLGIWNGALVLDSRQQARPDLLLIHPSRPPVLLLNSGNSGTPWQKRFAPGRCDAPPLLQAQVGDIDLDGFPDVVGLSHHRQPVLIHNDGSRLVLVREALGPSEVWPKDLQAATAGDIFGDERPHILLWSASQGLEILKNLGNGNHGLTLDITGKRLETEKLRCNADGIGVKVRVHAERLTAMAEIATSSAGLGHSRMPILIGLGKHTVADVVRLRWPDGTWQAELSVPIGQTNKIAQTNRITDSCPLLFTWDGQRYRFVCDFLGGGALGESLPDGSCRQPRAEESIKIEAGQLQPRDGQFLLKLGEPMDEVTYLDRLRLVVVDHAADVHVLPEERMASEAPSQDLHALASPIFPLRANNHRGEDNTARLLKRDRVMVDDFACRSWLGYAEEHALTLDFGTRLKDIRKDERVFLCLTGWTDYPYPEAMWAAEQAGVKLMPPVLEQEVAPGEWQVVVGDVGFPAGRPRTIMVEVTGKLGDSGNACRLRLKSNMRVYWDQIYLASVRASMAGSGDDESQRNNPLFRTTALDVASAKLSPGGMMRETSPDGKEPMLFDFHHQEPAPVTRLQGKLTRFGDVSDLLRQRDDRFLIFGPGDIATVAFDATTLPALPPGWKRSYVLRTWGYCKSASVFTVTGESIEPLPFAGMSAFPYPATENYPQKPFHRRYLKEYQTRGRSTFSSR